MSQEFNLGEALDQASDVFVDELKDELKSGNFNKDQVARLRRSARRALSAHRELQRIEADLGKEDLDDITRQKLTKESEAYKRRLGLAQDNLAQLKNLAQAKVEGAAHRVAEVAIEIGSEVLARAGMAFADGLMSRMGR